jgi:hypothetical protein
VQERERVGSLWDGSRLGGEGGGGDEDEDEDGSSSRRRGMASRGGGGERGKEREGVRRSLGNEILRTQIRDEDGLSSRRPRWTPRKYIRGMRGRGREGLDAVGRVEVGRVSGPEIMDKYHDVRREREKLRSRAS